MCYYQWEREVEPVQIQEGENVRISKAWHANMVYKNFWVVGPTALDCWAIEPGVRASWILSSGPPPRLPAFMCRIYLVAYKFHFQKSSVGARPLHHVLLSQRLEGCSSAGQLQYLRHTMCSFHSRIHANLKSQSSLQDHNHSVVAPAPSNAYRRPRWQIKPPRISPDTSWPSRIGRIEAVVASKPGYRDVVYDRFVKA